MLRPQQFRHAYVTLQNAPYSCKGTSPDGHSGGVIRRGLVVWLEEAPGRSQHKRDVTAFVEHTGLVLLDGRSLVRADILTPGPEPPALHRG